VTPWLPEADLNPSVAQLATDRGRIAVLEQDVARDLQRREAITSSKLNGLFEVRLVDRAPAPTDRERFGHGYSDPCLTTTSLLPSGLRK
jgi:hypothetical protein